jgi:predicted hydrolase (HD superfamily)
MRKAAHRYGQGAADETRWAITGLLHDADYDQWPNEHPQRIVAWLGEQGEPEVAHAVAAHFRKSGTSFDTPLDKALLGCDELTGFIMACCLVRDDGIHSLKPSSVKKKLKDRAFAAKVDREDVRVGMELLGAAPDDHIQMIIDALTPHAQTLGIAGRGAAAAGQGQGG